MHKELAALAMRLLPQARLPITKNDMAAGAALTHWLERIACGQLIVSDKPAELPEQPNAS